MQTSRNVIYILVKLNSRFISDYLIILFLSFQLLCFSQLYFRFRHLNLVSFKFLSLKSNEPDQEINEETKFHFSLVKREKDGIIVCEDAHSGCIVN